MKIKICYLISVIIILGFTGASCSWFNNNANDSASKTTTENTQGKETRPMMGQDSFGLAVCEEVPKTLVSESIGKDIVETEDWSGSTDTGCKYYTNKEKQQYMLVNVTYLSAENQKKGQESLGRTITTNSIIPIDHFIAMQPDGNINAIYLVMAPEKYSRVDRTDPSVTNDQLLNLAEKVANIILYK